jgi:hypothetical protein
MAALDDILLTAMQAKRKCFLNPESTSTRLRQGLLIPVARERLQDRPGSLLDGKEKWPKALACVVSLMQGHVAKDRL